MSVYLVVKVGVSTTEGWQAGKLRVVSRCIHEQLLNCCEIYYTL